MNKLLLADMASRSNTNTDTGAAAAALVTFIFFAVVFALAITMFVFWVIALIHLIQHEDVKDRILWLVLLFVIGGVIGPVYYFAVKKPYDKINSKSKK